MKISLRKISICWLFAISISSCKQESNSADAYGNFEATEIIVSSQMSGPLLRFNVNEGDELKAEVSVGFVDTLPFTLKLAQLHAQREAIQAKNSPIVKQVDVLEQQKKNLQVDQQRISSLLKDGSVAQKQLDDINAQLSLTDKQIESVYSQNASIGAELKSVDAQMAQVNDQIKRSYIMNPVDGTVLAKFVEQSEIVSPGKPLYKIADLSRIELRAYISGDQLSSVKIGQQVKVSYDTEGGKSGITSGTINWISSSAEFTPKIVQTKEQRTNLVYAIKVSVENKDGKIKIGMPGEMSLGK